MPTVSHRISTINAGGMAALLRSETMGTTTTPHRPQEQGLVGSVADETLTLNLLCDPLHLSTYCACTILLCGLLPTSYRTCGRLLWTAYIDGLGQRTLSCNIGSQSPTEVVVGVSEDLIRRLR